MSHVEPGGSWRPLWLAAAALAVLGGLELLLPAPDLPPLGWVLAAVAVLGVTGAVCSAARRAWTLRVDDEALTVGRERAILETLTAIRRAGAGQVLTYWAVEAARLLRRG